MLPFRTVLAPLPFRRTSAIAVIDWSGRDSDRARRTAELGNEAPAERSPHANRAWNRRKSIAAWLTVGVALLAISRDSVAVAEKPAKESEAPGLRMELRGGGDRPLASFPLPREAVRAFLYQGRTYSINVTEKHIAVDYHVSGVLFDRATGEAVRRFTCMDGWPKTRGPEFAEANYRFGELRLLASGIIDPQSREGGSLVTVAEVQFQGRLWRAVHRNNFDATVRALDDAKFAKGVRGESGISMTTVLEQYYGKDCCVEGGEGSQKPSRRYTMADGLASNIVTRLAVCRGALWAACADIYDRAKKDWGPGGLCRFDPKSGRWQRVETIDGRPVRWVTLLQAIDDELWVGFREGSGLIDDKISIGMGVSIPEYAPRVKGIVPARLSGEKWTSHRRAIRGNAAALARYARYGLDTNELSSEYPLTAAKIGNRLIVLLNYEAGWGYAGSHTGNLVAMLDLDGGGWRDFERSFDFGGAEPLSLSAAKGEVVVRSDRGAHRFNSASKSWQRLDPRNELQSQEFNAVALVGDELWVGYNGFGRQGISRYSEKTGHWTYCGPKELGTACPVRKFVTTNRGETWVLFDDRVGFFSMPQYGPLPEPIVQDGVACHLGLGRLADGKWQFPVESPTAVRDEASDPSRHFAQPDQLECLGNQLVYKTGAGLFVGPKPWKRIFDCASWVGPTRDGKGIIVRRAGPTMASGSGEYAVYNGTASELQFKDAEIDNRRTPNPELEAIEPIYDRAFDAGGWVQIPIDGTHRRWVVGPFVNDNAGSHTILVAPHAFWICSAGEIVRLDRKALDDAVLILNDEATLQAHPEIRWKREGRPVREVDPAALPPMASVDDANLEAPVSYRVPKTDVLALLRTDEVVARSSPERGIHFSFKTAEAASRWFANASTVLPAASNTLGRGAHARLFEGRGADGARASPALAGHGDACPRTRGPRFARTNVV